MFLINRRTIFLSCLLANIISENVFAAPSIYPTGVTRYDPAKAYNSYVLFAGQDKKTHLIDLNGNEVHQWPYDGFPSVFLDPQLVDDKGHVLVQLSGATGGRANSSESQSLAELDWDGKTVWQWGGARMECNYVADYRGCAHLQG